jgi:hypothetical protein
MAPKNGPKIIPGMEKGSPANVPTVAPKSALPLAPTFFAPKAVATKSTPIATMARTPVIPIVGQPRRVKSLAQAPRSTPINIKGEPGSAGKIVPATPAAMHTTATSQIEKEKNRAIVRKVFRNLP